MSRKMKDSGVEWIGEIPVDWDVCKIDSLYFPRSTKVSDKDYPPLSVTMKGIVPQLASTAKTDDHDNRKLVKKGDFAINSRSDRRGSCGISEYDGSVSLINTVLQPRHGMNNEYYNWLFHSDMFSSEFYRLGHGIVDDLRTTSWQEMKKMVIPAPSPTEQQQIVHFLDRKCTAIDTAIEKTKKSIEKLEEYKKAVITKAVTKGIDPNAKMKDSGVEWIGEIPEGWEVKQLRTYFSRRINKNICLQEKNLLSLSYGRIVRKNIDTKEGLLPESFDGYNIVEDGDIVIRGTDLQNDHRSLRTGLVTERGIITSAYMTLRPKEDVNSIYYHYLLHCYDISKVFYSMGGGLRQSLDYWEFIRMPILHPTDIEQEEIISYIKTKCTTIDNAIEKKKKAIEKWEEYKKSLIYYAVTGKIDCRKLCQNIDS